MDNTTRKSNRSQVIFDPIYGFIKLTPLEWELIHSPFYQRLRWIKQLGFSFYVFPGAEHSRFGHSIGVMYNAHKILQSCGFAVSDEELLDPKNQSESVVFHRSLRVGALMHDLGTFCFSHTTEVAYIRYGETAKKKNGKNLLDDHENLGSFIIKNTDYPGGITYILKKYGLSPQHVSDLVKGVSPSILANQILHSDVDCDRMDYLLRDAYYTGLKYGSYDRDYLLYHFQVEKVGQHRILTIKENALHCIEDFLISRFAWYSQVIRSPRGAKYDALAETLCYYLLENNHIYKYSDLLDLIQNDPLKFYAYNDNYFMNLLQNLYSNGELDKDPQIKDMASTLLLDKQARTIRIKEFERQFIDPHNPQERTKIIKRAKTKVEEIQTLLQKFGKQEDWMIVDLPKKEIDFVQSAKNLAKRSDQVNLLHERDPVKISREDGKVVLLADIENSLMAQLQNCNNYTPNVYCSSGAYELLEKKGVFSAT